MPRYFFHIIDDTITRDEEGLSLPDLEAARLAAERGARSLMAEEVMNGRLSLDHRIEVADEQGALLFALRFGDLVEISG